MKEFSKTFEIAGKKIEVSTGKMALLSAGALRLQMGNTVVLATANYDDRDTDMDYFPLGVEYIEKMYASGSISGSRFIKREGYPSEEAIIKARQVDHSIRSLFPKSFKKPTSVVLTILAYDDENDPEALAVFGASLALMQTGLPFMGPCASVIVCVDENDEVVINPSAEGREEYAAEFAISAVDGRILNLEGWGKEVSEEVMDKVLDESLKAIEAMNKFQREFTSELNVKKIEGDYNDIPAPEELVKEIKEKYHDEIEEYLYIDEADESKESRNAGRNKLLKVLNEELITDENEATEGDVYNALSYVERKIMREGIVKEEKRLSGRKIDEIRKLSAEVDMLPTVHGSALFSRGLTQSLSIITLASKSSAKLIDDMEGEDTKYFMHHYNMPNFTTGEAGRYNYRPGRREIGHGAIGENAIKNIIPSPEEFPYTIRAVSEIMTSNGSTSMAATCGTSLALMAAGVPMKEQVAGIGVGLVCEDIKKQDNYKILLDIEGIEDFYGDMDFKVCGTRNGITAIQYENKVRGVKPEILKEAFRLAQKGRMQVLEVMNQAISEPRENLADNAPVVEKIQIDPENIGELIGPGGKNIKALVESASEFAKDEVGIDIDDNGEVMITAMNRQQLDFVKGKIKEMFKKVEVGETYEGRVDKITEYGAFIQITPTTSGLCHISEITDGFIRDVSKVISEGDKVNVKVKGIERGKVSLTMKGVKQSEGIEEKMKQVQEGNKNRRK